MGHSDSEKLSKHKSELPKFTTLPFFGFHPEIRSSKRQENDEVMFLGDTDQYVYFSSYFGYILALYAPRVCNYRDTMVCLYIKQFPVRKIMPKN